PAVLALIDLYPLRRAGKQVWTSKIPYLALAAPFALIAPFAQAREGALQPLAAYGLVARAGQAAYACFFYLWKTLLAFGLNPFVRFPDRPEPLQNPLLLACIVLALGLCVAAVLIHRKRPQALVLWGIYLAALAPVSGIFQSGPHYVADRYTY